MDFYLDKARDSLTWQAVFDKLKVLNSGLDNERMNLLLNFKMLGRLESFHDLVKFYVKIDEDYLYCSLFEKAALSFLRATVCKNQAV